MMSPPTRLGRKLLTAAATASLAVGSLTAVVAPVGAQEATGATVNAVPADAVYYGNFNLDFESDQWLQVETLLERVGAPDIIEQARTELLNESDGEITEEQLEAFFGGEVGFYVLPSGVEAIVDQYEEAATTAMASPTIASPTAADSMDVDQFADFDLSGFGVVFEPGDADAVWTYLNDAIENDADSDATIETTTIGDADVLVITPNDEEFQQTVYLANTGELLVLTFDEAGLDLALTAAADEADSLADTDGYSQVVAELPAETASFQYYDTARLIAAIGEETLAGLENLSPATAATFQAEYFGGVALYADNDGFRLDSVSIPVAGGDLSTLVPEGTVTYDSRVPASTSIFFGGVFPPGTWDSVAFSVAQAVNAGVSGEEPTVESIDDLLSEEYIEQQLDDAEQILGFNLRDDFFAQFAGEAAFALTFPDLAGMSSLAVDTVAAIEVEDGAVVADSVERLVRLATSMAGDEFPVSTRTIGDDTVYVFGDAATTGVPTVEVGVVEDTLLIGTTTGVDSFVDGPDATLADDEDYQSTLALLSGDDYYQVAYIDLADIIPTAVAISGMGGTSLGSAPDADPACLEFDSQEEAQAAFDEDPFENSNLDQDIDDEACEDFFASATPAATPVSTGNPEAIKAFAAVGYEDGGNIYSSAILYIPETDE